MALVLAPALVQAQMFRGDAAHTGRYAGGDPMIVGLQWRTATDGDVTASPVVSHGVVYIGSGSGYLYALDERTGHVRWSYDAGSPIQSTAAMVGGLVLFGSRDGVMHALDAATGKPRWRYATGPTVPFPWGHESGDIWTSSPNVAGSAVVFGAGDGYVYALSAASGALRWRAATHGRIRGTPAVADGRVFVGAFDGVVYAFDLATGHPVWHYETLGTTLNSANFGFDRRSIQSSPSVANGIVYIGARDGFLYALDAATGQERWRDTTIGVVWSSPAVTDQYLYWGEGTGRVHVTDRASGRDLSVFATGAQVHSSPVVDGHLLIVGSGDGGIYALRLGAMADRVTHAVFFDSTYLRISSVQNAAEVALYLDHRRFATLDVAALTKFVGNRIADRVPSVVVFAIDAVPDSAVRAPVTASLFRRYLDAGGTVIWLGLPPTIWPVEPLHGERGGLNEVAWNAPSELLGVPHAEAIFDQRGVRATSAGLSVGLLPHWRSGWSVAPGGVTTVLGLDDWGLAAAWIKRYGRPEGTGCFIRVPSDNLLAIYLAASYRPLSE